MEVRITGEFTVSRTSIRIFTYSFSKTHYLTVIVQVIEDGYRVTSHFYGIVPTGKMSSAEVQLQALKDRFQRDGTLDSFKERLGGLVVDGAAVNVGVSFQINC